MNEPTRVRPARLRRLCLALAATFALTLTGCGDCCIFHHKKKGTDWNLIAAARQNAANGGGGATGGGGGGTGGGGGGGSGGGGGGGGGGGEVPEIRPAAAVGVLTLVIGTSLILLDRRRRIPEPVACA
jgi:hypothetical protein